MCLQGVPAPLLVGTPRNARRALRGHICCQPPPAGQPAGSAADEFRSRRTQGSPHPVCTPQPSFGVSVGCTDRSTALRGADRRRWGALTPAAAPAEAAVFWGSSGWFLLHQKCSRSQPSASLSQPSYSATVP